MSFELQDRMHREDVIVQIAAGMFANSAYRVVDCDIDVITDAAIEAGEMLIKKMRAKKSDS
jgi:hypothetical protein